MLFGERFVLAVFATIFAANLLTNPLKLDFWIRVGLGIVIVGAALITGRWMDLAREAKAQRSIAAAAPAPVTSPAPVISPMPDPGLPNQSKTDAEAPIHKEHHMSKNRSSKHGDVSVGDVNIKNNTAPTQVSIGSPGSKQVINEIRKLSGKVDFVTLQRGSEHVARLTFHQTTGFWEAGRKISIEVQFSGPYTAARFISGMPAALMDVRTTDPSDEAHQKGYFFLETSTPPIAGEPLVLEVTSEQQLGVTYVRASPTEGQ